MLLFSDKEEVPALFRALSSNFQSYRMDFGVASSSYTQIMQQFKVPRVSPHAARAALCCAMLCRAMPRCAVSRVPAPWHGKTRRWSSPRPVPLGPPASSLSRGLHSSRSAFRLLHCHLPYIPSAFTSSDRPPTFRVCTHPCWQVPYIVLAFARPEDADAMGMPPSPPETDKAAPIAMQPYTGTMNYRGISTFLKFAALQLG